jgi:hypothetical protein
MNEARILNITVEELLAALPRIRSKFPAEDADGLIIESAIHVLIQIQAQLLQNDVSIAKLKALLFGPKTEQMKRVGPPTAPRATATVALPKRKRPGHGRLSAEDYPGARRVEVRHPDLRPGCQCPSCLAGTLYAFLPSSPVLNFVGSSPVTATLYLLEQLRCGTCLKVFTAPVPPQAGLEKYDPSVAVILAWLRYRGGMPNTRIAQMQASVGVPLPEGTQWQIQQPLYALVALIVVDLTFVAANAEVVYNDDTEGKILDLRKAGSLSAAQIEPGRKGTFTTAIVAENGEHRIALFFTGWRHAGENLTEVLRHRDPQLPPPIQMCDALSRNVSDKVKTKGANCLVHGRREVVSLAKHFPEECRQVLEAIAKIYKADDEAEQLKLDDAARLAYHQKHSEPVMTALKAYLDDQIEQKKVEPNSTLGKAFNYLRKHWGKLTLFLREPGAPLDNNICEQAIKRVILHRKNSLFYKTIHGAEVGDGFMSVIHTCDLNGINPFDYLLALATHPEAVKADPKAWLPWNYPRQQPAHDIRRKPPRKPG